jgi:2'-5' RNA ligase
MKQTVRTFVAVEINATNRACAEELVAALKTAGADVKWVAPENLHLTVKFLGDVPLKETSQVCKAVGRGAEGVEPFELELRGAGAFPKASRPRTLWLGAGNGESQMVELHDRVEDALAELGYRKEHRRFHPHLTLGRVRRGGPGLADLAELLAHHADFDAGRLSVRRLTVFSSQLTPSGPIYEVLGRAELKGA